MKTYVLVTTITVYFLVTKFTVFLGLLLQKHAITVLLCNHFLSFSIIPSVPVSWKLSLSFRFPDQSNAHIFLLSCSYHIPSKFHTPLFNHHAILPLPK